MLASRAVEARAWGKNSVWASSILGLAFAGVQPVGCGASEKSGTPKCTTAVAVPCVGPMGCAGLRICSEGGPSECRCEGVNLVDGYIDAGHGVDGPLDSSVHRSIPDSSYGHWEDARASASDASVNAEGGCGVPGSTCDLSNRSHCGASGKDCLRAFRNVDLAGVRCIWNGRADDPGSCEFSDCAQDYFATGDRALGCNYYCTSNPDRTAKADKDNGGICDVDDDCDGLVDEDLDTTSDPRNCGHCGYACALPHGTAKCEKGFCALAGCDAGWWSLPGGAGCWYPCTLTNGGQEICDSADNDCDGVVDDALGNRIPASACP
jgi:hypothetical protein